MKKMLAPLAVAVAAVGLTVVAGCTSTPETMTPPAAAMKPLNDGEIPLPASYKAWPKFLTDIQRPDIKQIRDIYVNPTGYQAKAGQPFGNGTLFVMENWAVKEDAGKPVMVDGKLVKDRLLRVFVMAKGPGFGAAVPAELRTGDWVYTSYDPAGAKTADAIAACRACHVPLTSKDFVFRYDEYFTARSKGY